MIRKMIEAVYHVQSSDKEEVVNLIAIRPTYNKDLIVWEDTGRGTIYSLKEPLEFPANETPDLISFKAKNGNTYTLTKMTIERYNQYVREHAAGMPNFATDEELQNYYLNANFYG